MAARAGDVGYDQLHHFVAAGVWDSVPLKEALLKETDRLVGDHAGFLVIDDTALPKKGQHLVVVAPQYASSLGKTSNCQSLVSVTLASREVPMMVGLRLFLPESWADDIERMRRVRVPREQKRVLTKPEIAIEEIDRVIASGVRFGCVSELGLPLDYADVILEHAEFFDRRKLRTAARDSPAARD